MSAWHLGKNVDQAEITQRYQNVQHYNYMQYISEMQRATAINHSNPLAFGFSPEKNAAPMHKVTIENLPPGRPRTGSYEKPKLTQASMTYGEYRRMQEGYVEASEPSFYPTNAHTSHASNQRNSYGSDPRVSFNNRKNTKASAKSNDDGWGNDDSAKSVKTKAPKASDDWGDDEDSSAPPNKSDPVDIDWDEFMTSSEPVTTQQKKADRSMKSNNDSDDRGSTTSTSQRKDQPKNGWDDFDNSVSSSSAKPKTNKAKADDWSDCEDPKPPKKFDTYHDSNGHRGRGRADRGYHQRREGSQSSRNSSESHNSGRPFSRDRENTFRGNYQRDGSRSGSQVSSYRSSRPPREPRPGDWDCSKCKTNNYHFRTECFRCHESKGDNSQSSSRSHQIRGSRDRESRTSGFRNPGRGVDNNSDSYANKRNDFKPSKSGWSNDAQNRNGWDDNDSNEAVKRKFTASDDLDDDMQVSKQIKLSSAEECNDQKPKDGQEQQNDALTEDFWNDILNNTEPKPIDPVATEPLGVEKNDDDEWGSTKEKTVEEQEPQSFEAKEPIVDNDIVIINGK